LEFLNRYKLIILAALVVGVWWFMRRKKTAAAANGTKPETTVTGQPAFSAATVGKLSMEPMATQGTQIVEPRASLAGGIAERMTIGRTPISTMALSPKTLLQKTALASLSMGSLPPPPAPLPAPLPTVTREGTFSSILGMVTAPVAGETRSFSNLFGVR